MFSELFRLDYGEVFILNHGILEGFLDESLGNMGFIRHSQEKGKCKVFHFTIYKIIIILGYTLLIIINLIVLF